MIIRYVLIVGILLLLPLTGCAGTESLSTSPPPTDAPEPASPMIAFTSERDGDYDIYVMNADGGDLQQLTDNPGTDGYAAYSPDGTRIAYYAYTNLVTWSIYIMDADGGNPQRLTETEGVWDAAPAWSPDGGQIAFSREYDGGQEIIMMNPDGSDQRRIGMFNGGSPDWSPEGTQIVFTLEGPSDSDIYVMDLEGDQIQQLTDNDAQDWWPAWSPDGTQIAFMSDRDGDFEIFVMNADGSDPRQLTFNEAEDWNPDWSPDGSLLAFISMRDGNYEIYVMNPDGSDQRNLTNNPANDIQPAFLP
jgi:TolB protein